VVASVSGLWPRYRTTSRRWHAAARCWPVLLASFALGGCSFSYQLDSMLAKKTEAEPAGALSAAGGQTVGPAEADLAIARAAVSEVLSKGGKDTSIPWENPHTGARGTITPLSSIDRPDGITCRDFLASYVRNGSESWLQGEACRAAPGRWEVRNLRPWNNT